MGHFLTRLFDWFLGKKEIRIIMAGLWCAGKTTILYRLKLGKVVDTIPTIGFNVETVEFNDIKFTVCEFAPISQDLWKHYFHGSHALIYVFDSSDYKYISYARNELHSMLKEEAWKDDAALLVFANKQDKPDATSVTELTDALDLRSVKCRWYVQSASATSGEGLYEGMEWLVNVFAYG